MIELALTSAAQKARLNIAVDLGPPHMRPLYRAVRDHGVGLMIVPQRRKPFVVPTNRPTIVLVGDDLHAALGPAAFHHRSVDAMIRTSSGGVIVASGPEVAPYALVASLVVGTTAMRGGPRHVFLIETLPHRQSEWLDAIHTQRPGVTVPIWTVDPDDPEPTRPVDATAYANIYDGVVG